MSEEVKKFVDALAAQDNIGAGEAFKDALRSKVGDALDNQRKDVASKIFNPDNFVQPQSDAKPAVTNPSARTDQIMDADGNQIKFEPTPAEQPAEPASQEGQAGAGTFAQPDAPAPTPDVAAEAAPVEAPSDTEN